MRLYARILMIALAAANAACTPSGESRPDAAPTVTAALPDAASADCTGHFRLETHHFGTGKSECKKGPGVTFSADADRELPIGLTCDYTLTYIDPAQGSGHIACSDGSHGEVSFNEFDARDGIAAVKLTDGREITLTYNKGS